MVGHQQRETTRPFKKKNRTVITQNHRINIRALLDEVGYVVVWYNPFDCI